MRTAHLIVSGMAFAVWTAATVVYFGALKYADTKYWYLIGPAAVLPSFWCVYGWFAARQPEPSTSRWLTLLAVPVLVMGLGILWSIIADALANPPTGFGMGTGVVGVCGWQLALPFGLISFIWGIVLQVKRLRQPPTES